jgi:hypothetical protein
MTPLIGERVIRVGYWHSKVYIKPVEGELIGFIAANTVPSDKELLYLYDFDLKDPKQEKHYQHLKGLSIKNNRYVIRRDNGSHVVCPVPKGYEEECIRVVG